MPIPRPLAIAAAAALVAGVGVAAVAGRPAVHELTVALPDGGVQRIRYTGDAPPRLVAVVDPLADMVRIAAGLDAAMAATMAHADAMRRTALADGAAPAGAGVTMVSTTVVDGRRCTTTVRQVAGGDGRLQRLRTVAGDGCAAAPRPAVAPMPAPLPIPAPAPVPRDTI